MNADWVVFLGTLGGIAAYGSWRTPNPEHNTYLKGASPRGGTISLSVIATQASALPSFRSGQSFEVASALCRVFPVAAPAR
jgi:hypothetical protein